MRTKNKNNNSNNSNNSHFLIKSPRLRGEIVESTLSSLLLHPQQRMLVSELLSETNRKLPLTSHKILKKYLVYLIDYELISYNGQRHACQIEGNGIYLLYLIIKEKKRLMLSDSENLTITIEERGD